MQDIGGGVWQTEYPITMDSGFVDMEYHVEASDGLGNSSESYHNTETVGCGAEL
jgi:hypothetical protein